MRNDHVFTYWLQLSSGKLVYDRSGYGDYKQYSKCSLKFPTKVSKMSLYMEKLDDTTFLKLSSERKLIVVSVSKKGFPYSREVLPFPGTDTSHPKVQMLLIPVAVLHAAKSHLQVSLYHMAPNLSKDSRFSHQRSSHPP